MPLLLETSGSIDSNRDLLAVILSLCKVFNVFKVSEGPGEQL